MVANLREIEEGINRSTQAINSIAETLRRNEENDMVAETLDHLQLATSNFQAESGEIFGQLAKLVRELQEQQGNAKAKEQEYTKKVAHLDKILEEGVADAKSVQAVQDAVDGMNMGEVHKTLKQLSAAPSASNMKETLLKSPDALAKSTEIAALSTAVDKQFRELPKDLAKSTEITALSTAVDKQFRELPKELAKSTEITALSTAVDKQFRELPKDLAKSSEITALSTAVKDQLRELPKDFAKSTEITDLSATVNSQFLKLPSTIENKLAELTGPLAKSSEFTGLPTTIKDQITSLTAPLAKTSDVFNLPTAIKEKLAELTELLAKSSELTELPIAIKDQLAHLTGPLAKASEIMKLPTAIKNKLVEGDDRLAMQLDVQSVINAQNRMLEGDSKLARSSDVSNLPVTIKNKLLENDDRLATQSDIQGVIDTQNQFIDGDNKLATSSDVSNLPATIKHQLLDGQNKLAKSSEISDISNLLATIKSQLPDGDGKLAQVSDIITAEKLEAAVRAGNSELVKAEDIVTLKSALFDDNTSLAKVSDIVTAENIKEALLDDTSGLAKVSDIVTAEAIKEALLDDTSGLAKVSDIVTADNVREALIDENSGLAKVSDIVTLRTALLDDNTGLAKASDLVTADDLKTAVREGTSGLAKASDLAQIHAPTVQDIKKHLISVPNAMLTSLNEHSFIWDDDQMMRLTGNIIALFRQQTSYMDQVKREIAEFLSSVVRDELRDPETIENFVRAFLDSESVKNLIKEVNALNKKVPAELLEQISGLQVLKDIYSIVQKVDIIVNVTAETVGAELEKRDDSTAFSFEAVQSFWTNLCNHIINVPTAQGVEAHFTKLFAEGGSLDKVVQATSENGSLYKALGTFSKRVDQLEQVPSPENVLADFEKSDIIVKLGKFLQDVPDIKVIADLLAEVSKLAESRDNIHAVKDAIVKDDKLQQLQGIENIHEVLDLLANVAEKLVNAAPLRQVLEHVDGVRTKVAAVNDEMKKLTSEADGSLGRNLQTVSQALASTEDGSLQVLLKNLTTKVEAVQADVTKIDTAVTSSENDTLQSDMKEQLKLVMSSVDEVKGEVSKVLSTDEGGLRSSITTSLDDLTKTCETLSRKLFTLIGDDQESLQAILDSTVGSLSESLNIVQKEVGKLLDPETGRRLKRSFTDMDDPDHQKVIDMIGKGVADYTAKQKRVRLDQTGDSSHPALLRLLPANKVAKTVASFAPVQDTTTVIFGDQSAVIDLNKKLELGYIGHKSVADGQIYDRSVMALSTALDDIVREYGMPPLGRWPADVHASREFRELAQELRSFAPGDEGLEPDVMTRLTIDIILVLLVNKIEKECTMKDKALPSLQLGVCVRSSYYGGHAAMGSLDPEQTTIWMINEDPTFTSPFRWEYGQLWSAIASPQAMGEQLDEPMASLYSGMRRQLHNGVMKYARKSPALLEQRPGSSGQSVPTSRSRSRATYSMSDAQMREATTEVLSLSGLTFAPTMRSQAPPAPIPEQATAPLQAEETPSENSSAQGTWGNISGSLKRRTSKAFTKLSTTNLNSMFRRPSSTLEVGLQSHEEEAQGEHGSLRAQGQEFSELPDTAAATGAPASPSVPATPAPTAPSRAVAVNRKGQRLAIVPMMLWNQWGLGKYYHLEGVGDTYASPEIEQNRNLMSVLSNPRRVEYAAAKNRIAGKPRYCCESLLAKEDDGIRRNDKSWDNKDGPCNECVRLGRDCWVVISESLLVYKGSGKSASLSPGPDSRGRSPIMSRPGSRLAPRSIIQEINTVAAPKELDDHDSDLSDEEDDPDEEDEPDNIPDTERSTSRHVLTNAPEGTPIQQPPPGRVPVVPSHYGKGVMIFVGPPGATKDVINQEHFDQKSLDDLRKGLRGTAGRKDYGKLRAQSVKVNNTKLEKDFLSAARPLPAAQTHKGWANVDSHCDECAHLQDRECFLFINEEVVWYKHNKNYS